jgi:hypothetical protein
MIVLIGKSYSLKSIIPILLIVAGEAYYKSLVSNIKLTLLPNDILSPVGRVNNLLSSNTLLRLSIHSGSTSPSQITQHITLLFSLAALLAAAVNTPEVNSLVS